MLAQTTPTEWLSLVLSASAVLGGVGYATGQFLSSRRKGVGDSLNVALDEIEANRVKAERLAALASEKASELAEVRMENTTLRSVLAQGAPSDQILAAITKALNEGLRKMHEEHEKTRDVIRELIDDGRGATPRGR